MAKFEWKQYPRADAIRTGCKVGWRIYANRSLAEQCAEAARWNAKRQLQLGYDFGYQSPGNITELPDGRYEVCVP